jgi:hypothetical protein
MPVYVLSITLHYSKLRWLIRENTQPVAIYSTFTVTFLETRRTINPRNISSVKLLVPSNTYFIQDFPLSHTCNETQQSVGEYLLYQQGTRSFSLVIAKVIFLAVMKWAVYWKSALGVQKRRGEFGVVIGRPLVQFNYLLWRPSFPFNVY